MYELSDAQCPLIRIHWSIKNAFAMPEQIPSIACPMHLSASSVFPSSPPSLLPSIAVEALLPKFHIDSIMRLTHPSAKFIPITNFRLATLFPHPTSKVVCTAPARIHLPEERDELLCFTLLCERWSFRVVGCEGVQEGPCSAAESFDVWWTVARHV